MDNSKSVNDFYQIGYNYYFGRNGYDVNYLEAAKWFGKAIEVDDTQAMCFLGVMHLIGQGVEQDYILAEKLLQRAAEAGNSNAMYNLALMYKDGSGVAKDYTEAKMGC